MTAATASTPPTTQGTPRACQLGGRYPSRVSARRLLRRGYALMVTSSESAKLELRLVAAGTRLARTARPGDVVLTELRRDIAGRAAHVLRIGRAQRRLVRRGARLRLDLTLRDRAGNATRRSIAVRLAR